MSILLGFIGMPGWPEMLIVALIILLLFGNRLPSVMRSLGRGVVEFKKGVSGEDDDQEPDKVTENKSESTESKKSEKSEETASS